MPTARSGVSAVYYRDRIVVFGGEATGKVFGTNEAYDPKTDKWEALAPMKMPRHGLHGLGGVLQQRELVLRVLLGPQAVARSRELGLLEG